MNLQSAVPWIKIGGGLCENPLWNVRSQKLFWTDIKTGCLYCHDWAEGQTHCIYRGLPVGGFTSQEDDTLLLFRERDVAIFAPGDDEARVLFAFQHEGSFRFNDVIAAPDGSVFAGTMGRTQDSGGLFHIAHDGTIRQVFGGTGIANGLAFSPSLDVLYWVCSTRKVIFAFPYDPASGISGEPAVFHENTREEGIPDGLTTDADGNVYSIRWEAEKDALAIFSSEGILLHKQSVSAKATTSLCFCGPDLRQLAITSAALENDPGRPADLFRIDSMPVAGREEFRSRISIS